MGETNFSNISTMLYGFVLLMCSIAYHIVQSSIIRQQGKNSKLKKAVGKDKKGSVASGNSGINTYTGSYVVNGENITFSELTSTQLYGPRNIMEQEYKYLNILPNINSFKIVDNKTLKLVTSDGVELTFTRTT